MTHHVNSNIRDNVWDHAPGPISFGVRRGSQPEYDSADEWVELQAGEWGFSTERPRPYTTNSGKEDSMDIDRLRDSGEYADLLSSDEAGEFFRHLRRLYALCRRRVVGPDEFGLALNRMCAGQCFTGDDVARFDRGQGVTTEILLAASAAVARDYLKPTPRKYTGWLPDTSKRPRDQREG